MIGQVRDSGEPVKNDPRNRVGFSNSRPVRHTVAVISLVEPKPRTWFWRLSEDRAGGEVERRLQAFSRTVPLAFIDYAD